jgi:uncharacterized RDD family membrane protein YckC
VSSTDKLTIDTPELITLELPLAGIGSRFLALAIDSLLQVVVLLLVLLTCGILMVDLGGLFKAIGPAIIILSVYCLYWGYFAFFEIVWNGQTPGKRLIRIRVIKESGRPITPLEAIARNIMRGIDIFPPFFYIVGLFCMMLNSRNKRLGDFVAGTVLVHDKKVETVSAIWKQVENSSFDNVVTSKITPEELLLIETYLNRRSALDLPVRKKNARQIVLMIREKIGVDVIEGVSDDALLEAVARKVRDSAKYR